MIGRVCERCGEGFLPAHKQQRYCGPICRSEARREAARRPRPSRRRREIRRCQNPSCGVEFEVHTSDVARGGGKFCSRTCFLVVGPKRSDAGTEAVRKQMLDRKGAKNPNYRGGARAGVRNRAGEKRWRSVLAARCVVPGCPSEGKLVLHHVVYEQHVRREHGDVWDPGNALTLCPSCHSSHHRRGRVLPISVLRIENVKFAAELLGGDRAQDYLCRYYRDDVPARWWTAFAAGIWWLEEEAVQRVR